ncbi:adenylate kinase 7 isoform X2 [Dunckerocampus dactyliophorus]|uniref:adenylate kinase 7 isoform X2 n=1 Tax=Dunckerocampus dactyliophorus TaxID=161453 RepID=UPI0024065C0F|nr:adenylate kinase 7 isoform X2 [Dunckerocampus dactyliophorus]
MRTAFCVTKSIKWLSKQTLQSNATTDREGVKVKSNDNVLQSYPVVGTLSEGSEEDTPYLQEAYVQLSREMILEKLLECDVIIYNITQHPDQVDEACWAVSALHNKISSFTGPKMFILVSTVMTWACSEAVISGELELPFTDDDFRRRQAHPNFKQHIELEKLVAKLGRTERSSFSTYIVVSGLQYGMGEQVLHLFFRMSWLGQEKEIPVFGEGNNIVPTIHIRDLASVIHKVIELQPKPYYLLAVDYSNNTMKDIVKAIAVALGPGKIQKKPFEEAFLEQELSIMEINLMNINLCMEAAHLKEQFSIRWVCEFGLVENIELVVEEFRQIRGLVPVRICVLGPPAVGKSSLSQQICDHYKLHHIQLTEAISETISHLEHMVRTTISVAENEESPLAIEAQELLNIFKENLEQNGGMLDDHLLVRVVVDKLMTNPCKNQGFVLDGFPKTYNQAKEVFHVEEQESEDKASPVPSYNKKIMPEFVFCLEASDAFLKERVINLPEKLLQEHKYEQENFLQMLVKYREKNMEEQTVVNYFEEHGITPFITDITDEKAPDSQLLMHSICESVGQPRNYGLSSQEVQKEGRIHTGTPDELAREQKEVEDALQRSAHWEMWTKTLEEKRQWEVQQLEVLTVPMKNYLMDMNIMTTMSQGLIACGSAWPEDPIDFLAEYLLKNNP